MVEQTREPRRAVSPPQAGPDGDEDVQWDLLDGTLRTPGRSTRALGRQLAVIGDQLDRMQAIRHSNGSPVRRDVHRFLGGLQGLCGGLKTRMAPEGCGAFWVSHWCTNGAFLTAALSVLVRLSWRGESNRP